MPYTWTTQHHNTTAGRNNIQVELWAHLAHGWENFEIRQADTLDDAYEIAGKIRANHAFLEELKSPIIIAAVRFAPRGHHRLVTWYGTYNEGGTDA